MPVNSSIFNKFFSLPLLLLVAVGQAGAQLPTLTDQQLDWLGDHIYQNECNRRSDCLTSWNIGENFPSLGIGHFIWFRADQVEIYTESFPELLDFYQRSGVQLPAWLADPQQTDSPWPDRTAFYNEIDGERLQSLRQFLLQTQEVQVAFIVQRMHLALPRILAAAPAAERDELAELFYQIASSQAPLGMYALIDYIHFKGEGVSPGERYNGQGWGLLQVLQTLRTTMASDTNTTPILALYAEAAASVLHQRVANAPPDRKEERWLAGWLNRVASYCPDSL